MLTLRDLTRLTYEHPEHLIHNLKSALGLLKFLGVACVDI